MDYNRIDSISRSQHPNNHSGKIQYGTAGFRTNSDALDHVLYRMGILTVLRSKLKNAAIGLMITASHNEEPDNGVKLVDPAGEMLESSWEDIATHLANVPDSELVSTLKKIVNEQNINEDTPASVIIGRDSRESGWALSRSAIDGINAADGSIQDFGIITTPQLHYLIVCSNTNGAYGESSVEGYFSKLGDAFLRVKESKNKDIYLGEIYLDAANGVGGIAAKEFQKILDGNLTIRVFNDGNGALNYKCGADYVKVQQRPPLNSPVKPFTRCVSIDGDADRVVYYYIDECEKFHLLDGDRIATLTAGYLKELVEESGLNIRLGLVQTAYANGASTNYISQLLKVPVVCTDTGVKHLHRKALEFDIGVYFEANGHGTVVVKQNILEMITIASQTNRSLAEKCQTAALKLKNLIDIVNQTVGDALSDMLLVEAILYARGWDVTTWEKSYADLPNRQLKVKVQDRNVIQTSDAARKCISPPELQDKINELVARYRKGRAFVRASGTEDVVRIYAECDSPTDVEKLAAEVALAVYRLAGGVGSEPIIPT
ncbi:phosphoacetylglucosamine mutase isoform X2 [Diachasma alloeum]|uniref:phosphoacetylglucosamine mutase isoform X2 n=1 Tax=Diachasma alloeum TaxID=454923 RepID=UPI000738479B|nr:phosphoacetylglucosamine mutase isoform X2 [Diachasma alloeum]